MEIIFPAIAFSLIANPVFKGLVEVRRRWYHFSKVVGTVEEPGVLDGRRTGQYIEGQSVEEYGIKEEVGVVDDVAERVPLLEDESQTHWVLEKVNPLLLLHDHQWMV